MTAEQHNVLQVIAGAMEEYGESAVFDVVSRLGNYAEIIASVNIEAGMKLQRIAKYHTRDEMTFTRKEQSLGREDGIQHREKKTPDESDRHGVRWT